jgi:hypothetical protein
MSNFFRKQNDFIDAKNDLKGNLLDVKCGKYLSDDGLSKLFIKENIIEINIENKEPVLFTQSGLYYDNDKLFVSDQVHYYFYSNSDSRIFLGITSESSIVSRDLNSEILFIFIANL